MILGCIADDFTGAGDLANTLSRGGMHTRLFVGTGGVADDCQAGVVALKTRSIMASDAVAQSLEALDWLLGAGCRQIFFKYCSTFDSTAQGNIGPVAEALAQALDARGVVVCPSFPGAGRTVYQGHLFVSDRLLSESGMERHPLTPMSDPDIRRWLAAQSRNAPGHIAWPVVRAGADAVRAALEASTATLVIVDAIDDDDLRTIGNAAAGARLITGGSGVALALPGNFRDLGLIGLSTARFRGKAGPALLLSGSCSAATRGQVERYRSLHPSLEIDVDDVMTGSPVIDHAAVFLDQHRDQNPLIYSSAEPDNVRAAQARHGTEATAQALEELFGTIAREAVMSGFDRIIVAGGETSGAVVKALQLSSLEVGPEIDPGVPALNAFTSAGREIAITLKSGNFGREEFLSAALAVLGGHDA